MTRKLFKLLINNNIYQYHRKLSCTAISVSLITFANKVKRSARLRIAQARLINQTRKQRFDTGDDKLNPQRHQQQPHNTCDDVDTGLA